jgi:hypothetical protein
MCDYHNVPFAEDVAWDIDTVYLSHASKELVLSDFDHLDARFMPPIISALEYNSWFTKLNLSNIKMTAEVTNEVLKVMKSNSAIREVILCNTGINRDFMQKFAASLSANPRSELTCLNLSENSIEDKGLQHLLPVIGKLSRSLCHLNLSRTGITPKGVNELAKVFVSNAAFAETLKVLDISENNLKNDEIKNLHSFLSHPNNVTSLNLAGTECSLESLFGALSRGCIQHIEHLDVSRNVYSFKKPTREVVVSMSWKEFFASVISLRSVNFSGSRQLPSEALNCILVGLSINQRLKNLDLNLSSCNLGSSGSQVLECLIGNISCIGSLDISDNGFDQTMCSLLAQLTKNRYITRLAIGRNKPRVTPQLMEAIVNLIQNSQSSLRCLLLDDLKLRGDLSTLLSALGSNNTLVELDISGNQAGDICARMLSKALMMNTKLSAVYWDRNNTSPQGFTDVATALEKNFTIKKLPVAINDVVAAMRQNMEKTEQSLQKIENLLQRNRESHRLSMDQMYRLTHGLMTSSTQQMVDGAMAQLENMIGKLQSGGTPLTSPVQDAVARAQNLIRDITSTRQILLDFQSLASDSESDSGAISARLKLVAADIQNVVEKQLKSTADTMMQRAEKQYASILFGKLKEDLKASAANACTLPNDHVRNVVMQRLSCDILNSVSEVNFSVANFLYNGLVEEFMSSLDSALSVLKQAVASCPTYPDNPERQTKKSPVANNVTRVEQLKKTLNCRKLRPQSTFDLTRDVSEYGMPRTAAEMGEAKRAPDVAKKAQPQSAQPSMAHLTGTTRSIFSPSFDYDCIMPDDEIPKLSHPSKDRPKMHKSHFVKRPVIACESLLIDDDDDSHLANYNDTAAAVMSPGSSSSSADGSVAVAGRSPFQPNSATLRASDSSDDSRASHASIGRTDSGASDTLLSPPSSAAPVAMTSPMAFSSEPSPALSPSPAVFDQTLPRHQLPQAPQQDPGRSVHPSDAPLYGNLPSATVDVDQSVDIPTVPELEAKSQSSSSSSLIDVETKQTVSLPPTKPGTVSNPSLGDATPDVNTTTMKAIKFGRPTGFQQAVGSKEQLVLSKNLKPTGLFPAQQKDKLPSPSCESASDGTAVAATAAGKPKPAPPPLAKPKRMLPTASHTDGGGASNGSERNAVTAAKPDVAENQPTGGSSGGVSTLKRDRTENHLPAPGESSAGAVKRLSATFLKKQ